MYRNIVTWGTVRAILKDDDVLAFLLDNNVYIPVQICTLIEVAAQNQATELTENLKRS